MKAQWLWLRKRGKRELVRIHLQQRSSWKFPQKPHTSDPTKGIPNRLKFRSDDIEYSRQLSLASLSPDQCPPYLPDPGKVFLETKQNSSPNSLLPTFSVASCCRIPLRLWAQNSGHLLECVTDRGMVMLDSLSSQFRNVLEQSRSYSRTQAKLAISFMSSQMPSKGIFEERCCRYQDQKTLMSGWVKSGKMDNPGHTSPMYKSLFQFFRKKSYTFVSIPKVSAKSSLKSLGKSWLKAKSTMGTIFSPKFYLNILISSNTNLSSSILNGFLESMQSMSKKMDYSFSPALAQPFATSTSFCVPEYPHLDWWKPKYHSGGSLLPPTYSWYSSTSFKGLLWLNNSTSKKLPWISTVSCCCFSLLIIQISMALVLRMKARLN